MKTQLGTAATRTVATTLPTDMGPLGQFLQKQAEARILRQDLLHCLRAGIMNTLAETMLFSEAERLQARENVHSCKQVAQLQRWYYNVHRLYQERLASFYLFYADRLGRHAPVLPLLWIG